LKDLGAGQALDSTGLAWDGNSEDHRSQQGGLGTARASVGCPSWPKASSRALALREVF